MNFLRDRSLKQLAAYLLILLSLVYVAEYFIIRSKIDRLDQAERKIDFTRSVQIENQHLSLQLQLFLNGKKELAADIASRMEHQDHLLRIISEGGRIDGTDHFLGPLPRLPRITFDHLSEKWAEYKKNTAILLNGEATVNVTTQPAVQADTLADSVAVAEAPAFFEKENPGYAKSSVRTEGLSLSVASWYDKLIADLEEEVSDKRNAILYWLITLFLIDVALLMAVYYVFRRFVLKPLNALATDTVSHHHINGMTNNEIGHLARQINETVENLKDATDFVTAIGQGNLNVDYKETLDANYHRGKNKLADSLIDMQSKLKDLNEEERKRQWANEGLSKFVDILRSSNDNIEALGDKVISTLVQYTGSNQGGLYLLNDEDERNKFLELISLFAFDIKKYTQQRLKLGEGILGQTFLERETTYLTNLPDDYIRITSGLGDANPKSILIVPLKVDTEVYGLVELASFREYQPYEIAFVEKLGESIASTLASVRAAQKNRQLIEQFQQQTEMMRAQEEEMRQNMEELQATQEEVVRKERNYLSRIQELEEQLRQSPTEAVNEEALKEEYRKKEAEYRLKIGELEKLLAQASVKGDDWEQAKEVEKALRINLEALRITRQELDR